MLDITPIVEAFFTLLTAVVSVLVLPFIKAKIDVFWVRLAVDAAEQLYKGHGRGEEKKAHVVEWLKKNNITVNQKRLDIMLEAAVGKLNQELTGKSEGSDGKESEADDDAGGSQTAAGCSQG